MLNRKRLVSRIAFVYFILVLLSLLIGCSGTNTIYQDIPVYVHTPPIQDTLWLKDTVYYYDNMLPQDSLWYSDVVDSLNKKIGSVEVYYKKKIARLKLNAKTDTLLIRDTVKVPTNTNPILPVIVNSLTWWEQTILFGGLGIILALLTAMRVKRGKII